MILVGGSNVYPAEMEAALDEHPKVASSCVIGLPDEEYGNVVHAIVQALEPLTASELDEFWTPAWARWAPRNGCSAKRSCCVEGDTQQFRAGLTVLQPLSDDPEGKRLNL